MNDRFDLRTDPFSREQRELLDKILNAPVRFWTCPVCVRPEVRWVDGGLWAVCVNCGRTSKGDLCETSKNELSD